MVFAPFWNALTALISDDSPIASLGDELVAVRSTPQIRNALPGLTGGAPEGGVAQALAAAAGAAAKQLPDGLFHRTSLPHNASGTALLCLSDTLKGYRFPWWNTTFGAKGYLTDDERHFWLLAYEQCGRPYRDPYHSLEMWTPPAGEPVASCGGQQQRRPSDAFARSRRQLAGNR
eukprot:Hpha_TRINITY_DN8358_c0_g1::TRINITY_DN8358_c0_g1_i1::g.154300::m.154300